MVVAGVLLRFENLLPPPFKPSVHRGFVNRVVVVAVEMKFSIGGKKGETLNHMDAVEVKSYSVLTSSLLKSYCIGRRPSGLGGLISIITIVLVRLTVGIDLSVTSTMLRTIYYL